MDMNAAITKLIEAIKADYRLFFKGREDNPVSIKMIEEFNERIRIINNPKYIRVVTGNSVWGFIVNTQNDKEFKYGDILKAAGWKSPARNQARGNVFEDYEINWTGPNYLR